MKKVNFLFSTFFISNFSVGMEKHNEIPELVHTQPQYAAPNASIFNKYIAHLTCTFPTRSFKDLEGNQRSYPRPPIHSAGKEFFWCLENTSSLCDHAGYLYEIVNEEGKPIYSIANASHPALTPQE